jgi:glycosyltransferase involved in cell wall biosynthesis
MKVSIIVPVYNTGKYLRQCLQSLKEQSLNDIEVICVNDGSTDDSQEIIESFVMKDQRFKAIHKSNTGYGNTVNTGIKAAKAKYIGILESDDFAEPNMFQRLYDTAENYRAELVKANYNLYSESLSSIVKCEEMLGGFPYERIISVKDNLKVFGIHPSVWSALYRKSYLEENDILFLETPGASYQDISFAFKVFSNAERVCFIKDSILNYRVDNVDSSVHNPQKIFCVCDELNEIERYINERAMRGTLKKEWRDKLYKIVAWIKYRNYMWNYMRLSLPYQYAFLLNVQDELRDIRLKESESDLWEDVEKETLNRMIDDPHAFLKITGRGYEDPRLSLIPVLNHSFSIRCFQDLVTEFQEIYIYGAGKMAQNSWYCLKKMQMDYKVKGFIVSEQKGNPRQIEDKNVFVFTKMKGQYNENALIIVALHRQYQYEISLELQAVGCSNILLIDDRLKSWIFED